tara:strand:+ start:312 stop:1016 length:705 start_codon:yes stop_codon:yes gene_type:complete
MATNTTNYSWSKPTVGGDEDAWGGFLNGNWDSLDTLLGGVTNTEFEILDGATLTTIELNYMDGVTSNVQTQLNAKGTVSSLSDLSVTATSTELNYVSGVTSAIQTQINTKITADVTGEFIADSYNETYAAVTSTSNATTVNCHNGNSFSHTLTENTTFTFSNPPASGTGYTFSIEIIQDASASGFSVTWPSSVDWPAATAPTLTATASAKDVFVFTTRDGGTTWYGFTAGQALA